MAEPNRLRDQSQPGVYRGPSYWVRPSSADAPSEHPQWGRRRIAVLSALATVAIIVTCALLISSATVAGVAVPGWLIGFVGLGARVAIGGGGRRSWAPAVLGLMIGGLAVGAAIAVGVVVGIVPEPADDSGPTGVLALVFLVPVLLLFFGSPVLLFGAVLGSVIADVRVERRHRAVARGTIGLLRPTVEKESRTWGSLPLDDLAVAKVTSDGAATTVIREYPLDADPDTLVGADTARLATIGYALESVVRRPGKTGIGWGLIAIGAALLDVALIRGGAASGESFAASILDARRGRVIATFRIRSMTHEALRPPDSA